jgi:hypothetical protein
MLPALSQSGGLGALLPCAAPQPHFAFCLVSRISHDRLLGLQRAACEDILE